MTRSDEPPGDRALGLFDPSGTAHSGNALQGLARAAFEMQLATTVYAHPSVRSDLPASAVRWHEAEGPGELGDTEKRHAHRAVLLDALADFGPGPDRVFCDLGLDRTLASRGAMIPATPRTVFVCHRVGALDRIPRRWSRRLRRPRAGNRNVLRRLGRTGARFVVHTEAVGERLADFVPAEHITCLGWPVLSRDAPSLAADWEPSSHDCMVLFAGSLRVEKGFEPFMRAVPTVTGYDRVVIPGRVPSLFRDAAAIDDPRIELWDRWLGEDEYTDVMARAALVVLPYQREYVDRGTVSSVLLEAMALGRPLLVSDAIAHLLPPGYRGAVVTDAGTEAGIADGLRRALAGLDDLERAAMSEGRRFVADHNNYADYVSGLVRAGSSG